MDDLALAVFVQCVLPALLIVAAILLTCFAFMNNQDQADPQRPETVARPPPVSETDRTNARRLVPDTLLPSVEAAQMAMAYIAMALLDRVSYPRHNSAASALDAAGASPESEDCAICLGTFEDGDWCSIMPVCRHEFHRACIEGWFRTYNHSCPLCRAQLRWSVVAEDMV